jgi:hypothetical protein
MSRVSSLPLVNSAIKVYEQGKASNRVLNYGAGLVESSVKTIAAPLYGTLGKHVRKKNELTNALGEFFFSLGCTPMFHH